MDFCVLLGTLRTREVCTNTCKRFVSPLSGCGEKTKHNANDVNAQSLSSAMKDTFQKIWKAFNIYSSTFSNLTVNSNLQCIREDSSSPLSAEVTTHGPGLITIILVHGFWRQHGSHCRDHVIKYARMCWVALATNANENLVTARVRSPYCGLGPTIGRGTVQDMGSQNTRKQRRPLQGKTSHAKHARIARTATWEDTTRSRAIDNDHAILRDD